MNEGLSRVHIYDPNVLNPYGFELARTLVEGGEDVTLWTSRAQPSRPVASGALQVKRVLAADRSAGVSLVKAVVERLWGIVRLVASARRTDVVVVAWTRDCWDTGLLLLRTLAGGRIVTVYHNPRQIRPRSGLVGWLEQRLLKRGIAVVHSAWLKQVVQADLPHVRVATHPPYLTMRRFRADRVADEPTFIYVGALRPDKGSAALLELGEEARRSWTLQFVGAGAAADAFASQMRPPIRVVNLPEHARPSDEILAHELSAAWALVAPYDSVTTSGTMVLAATLGVPVVTFDSPALEGLPSRLVRSAETVRELAEIVDDLATEVTPRVDDDELPGWLHRCREEWRAVIKSARA
ncbi:MULTISPECIES: glycosyltransferase [unclassified Microbacterium]|uniref:glycosyltransferase n=1 Tax=unclassified Microbacterium TaxID=2609290 RepID=UPI003C2DB471